MRFLRRLYAPIVFQAGSRRQLQRLAPRHLGGASGPLMLLGMALGLALAGVWNLTYVLTRPHLTYGMLTAEACAAAACAAVWVGLACRQGFLSLAETIVGRWKWVRWPALAGVAVAWAALLNCAVRWNPDWPTHLPPAVAWLWPRALYRAIMLAPLWGSWSMLVLPKFHRPAALTDPHTRTLAERTSPLAAATLLALPLAGSFIYLMFLNRPVRFIPPAAAILAALGGGTVMIRIRGRLCREALLAANVLTQSAFLLAYLAVR